MSGAESGPGDGWVVKASWIHSDVKVETPLGPEANRAAVEVRHLVLPDHGVTAVVGESGSGKSSLLAMLTGLKPVVATDATRRLPDGERSEFLFRGRAGQRPLNMLPGLILPGKRPLAGDIGFVFQDAHLLKSLSAERNASFGAVIAPGAPTTRVFSAWARLLDLSKSGFEPLETYSGGQQQRIAVMRALGMDPALLVCDEPTSSLDGPTADKVMSAIFEWASQPGRAVLWVTHSRELAGRYAHRFLAVHRGQLLVTPERLPIEQVPAGADDQQCRRNMDQIASALQGMADTPGAVKSLAPMSRAAPAGPRRETSCWSRCLTGIRSAAFTFVSSMAIAFADIRRVQASKKLHWLARTWPVAAAAAAWRLAFRSLSLVLLLGMVVFYGLFTAYTAFDRHFERQLASPQIAHFTVVGKEPALLAPPILPRLDDVLKLPSVDGKAGQPPSESIFALISSWVAPPKSLESPKHYGRRTSTMSPVWPAEAGKCERSDSGSLGPPMLVYNRREPLFAQLVVTKPGGQRARIDSLEPRQLLGGAIVTRGLFAFLRVDVTEEDKVDGFCVNLDFGATVYLRIVGIVPSLPGGGDRQFMIALDEGTYQDSVAKAPLEIRRALQQGPQNIVRFPAYQQAAAYFDYRDRDRVFCGYLGCDPDKEDPVIACQAQSDEAQASGAKMPLLPGYRIDCDALAQVTKLVETAGGAKLMFLALSVTFLLSIILSTALAAAALVNENAKPIAVMRAFGYTLSDLFVLLFGQLIVLLLMALLMFYLLVAGFDAYVATDLARSVGAPVSDILSSSGAMLLSVGGIALTVGLVAIGVLLRWRWKNRHVGPLLQSL